jgi:signal transduction histidine kinase/ligand-binding sensor domain-containing protein/DNA-binding response OmpR family regulator
MIGSSLSLVRVIKHPDCPSGRLDLLPLVLFLLLTNLQLLIAQEKLLPVFHFQRVKGIFNDQIRSRIVRDVEGFIWIGTLNGLERYDGYSVKDYRNIPDDPHSLSSNYVPALLVDRRQRLWVGTYDSGLSLYDRVTDRFFNLFPRSGDTSWYQAKTIARMLEDRHGNIWLASRFGGVVRMGIPADSGAENPDTFLSRIRFTTYALGTPLNSGTDLLERADGKILVASDSGLIILDPSTHSISRLNFDTPTGCRLDSASVQCLCRDSNDVTWAGTESNGLFRIDWDHRIVKNFRHSLRGANPIASDNILDIALNRRGDLWVGTDAGIQLLSAGTGQCIPYLTAGPAPAGRSYMTMLSIERSGTLWVGTAEGGVHWLSQKSQLISHYSLPNRHGSGPRGFESIERDHDGRLWFSSSGMIFQIDIATRKVLKIIDVFKGKKPTFHEFGSFIDSRGTYWYSTWGLGLFRVDLSTGTISNYGAESGLGKNSIVNGIAQGSGDSLWIAAHYDGLKKFDPITGRFSDVSGFSKREVWSVMRDHRGRIWITSALEGITILNPATGAVEALRYSPSDPRSLSSDHGRAVIEDSTGSHWIGSGNMVNLWDPTTSAITRFPNPAFRKALFARPLGTDRKGRLWVDFLNGGESFLDPSTGVYTDFDWHDGITGELGSMVNLEDGRVILGGPPGLYLFHPDSLDRHRPAPPLVLTRMGINDEPVPPPLLVKGSGSLNLPYLRNVLEFEFVAIDIDAPSLVEYQYRLEGLEREWVKPKDRRFVRYTNLAPSNYIFKVRSASLRGDWPDQEIALAITIFPPWWRTSWAYAGYAFLLLGFLYAGYRLRLRQIHLKQDAAMEHFQAEHLAEVDRLKSRFFANISHEFRTPLTLILGPAEKGIETAQDPSTRERFRLIKSNANKLFGLVNQLLDFSRLESGMMRLQVSGGDIVQFLRRVVMSFESWAERKRIGLEFQSDAESIPSSFDADKLEKIFNNVISNALKFTSEGGQVKVILNSDPGTQNSGHDKRLERVRVTVSDTGMGIAEDKLPYIFDRFYRVDETHTSEGTGIGLALTKELVDLHYGTITVESAPGKGSVFTVTIPIEKSTYAFNETAESPPAIKKQEYTNDAGVSEQSNRLSTTPPADGKPIVLVVDDNADLRVYIRESLEADYGVQEAQDGKQGYDRATEIVPDLVISDVMMPEMDGMELCRALKQDVRTSHVPVILLTARAGTDSKIKGLEGGADDYVTKPFDTKELVVRVRNLIEQRRQLRRQFSSGIVLKPGEVAVTSLDDGLLKKVMAAVEKNMKDENFDVDDLAREACLSRTHLNRKLKALTNLSTGELIRYIRLQRARELLEKNAGSIADIAYQVGFASPSYLSTCFRERFGYPPSEVHRHLSAPS